jgi:hypothetical protein
VTVLSNKVINRRKLSSVMTFHAAAQWSILLD